MYKREPLPYYAGLVSFFRTPAVEIEDITEGMAVVAGVPIDMGVIYARVGERFGPRAIREWSMAGRGMHEQAPDRTMYDVVTEVGSRLKDKPNVADFGDFNLYLPDIKKTGDSVISGMTEIVKRGAFPVVVGGDHYVAYPSFTGFAQGLAERKPNARLGYIHLDSHSDFNDGSEMNGRYTHGTCVRRISENPMIDYKNLAWVGLNKTLTADQLRLRRAHNLKMTTDVDIIERGIEQVMREAMEVAADGTDAVYVSVDIDIITGSESPGTGLSEPRGITGRQFLTAMNMLSGWDKLGAIDFCEVAPEWDPGMLTVMLATSGMMSILRPYLYDTVDLKD